MNPVTNEYRKVREWVAEAFEDLGLYIVETKVTGGTEKGDGYLGDIVFLHVSTKNSENQREQYNVAVKLGKSSKNVRANLPVQLAYEREIFFYSILVPQFRKLEEEPQIELLKEFLPKCFAAKVYDNQEVLILQNLRELGYEIHDKFVPLNQNHLTLTFKNYGIWHAMSFAYRAKHPKDFEDLLASKQCVMTAFLPTLNNLFPYAEKSALSILEKHGQLESLIRLRKALPQGYKESFKKLLMVQEENSVAIHGDCWNNNFMYKYEDSDKQKINPRNVVFLDFQCVRLAPPVFDLSYHLYSTASESAYKSFNELLHIYHSSITDTLKMLGCDAEQIFPYKELVRQWKEYSGFGFLIASAGLAMTLTKKQDVLELENIAGAQVEKMYNNVEAKSGDDFSKRTLAAVDHWLYFNDYF